MKKRFAVVLTLFVFAPVAAVAVLAFTNSFEMKELPIYGEVPPFALTERTGQEISRDSLKGKVWVASFIFTHCAGQCPLLCEKLKEVQRKFRFKEHFRLVSITMDPERDTPEVLEDYANRFQADPYKWLFLTGGKKEIDSLVQNGFRLASSGDDGSAPESIIHSFKVVLVDRNGRIRGYYDGLEDGSIKQLIRDTKGLIKKAY